MARRVDRDVRRVADRVHAVRQAVEEAAPLTRFARRARRDAGGREMHDGGEVDRPEEQHRVEVLVADSEADVHDRAVVPGAAPARGTDDLATVDAIAAPHGDRREERVRRAHPARVRDDYVTRTGD